MKVAASANGKNQKDDVSSKKTKIVCANKHLTNIIKTSAHTLNIPHYVPGAALLGHTIRCVEPRGKKA